MGSQSNGSRFESRTAVVHGNEISYRTGGSGPVVLLIHGMAGSSRSWKPVLGGLSDHVTYVAPDLPGHGKSSKPRGDYSLGAQASLLRDLLLMLGHERVTVVGTSLGGGIAMQFAYQYPEMCERLGLVCAGGLGQEVMPVLRVLSSPAANVVLPVVCQPFVRTGVETAVGWLSKIGLQPTPTMTEKWSAFTSLIEPDTRSAFLHTLRGVVDGKGQRVSATDRLYLTSDLPTLIVWGDEDNVIPVEHGRSAHETIPNSTLAIMEGCGHFPYAEEPALFVRILCDFVAATEPGVLSGTHKRKMLERGSGPAA